MDALLDVDLPEVGEAPATDDAVAALVVEESQAAAPDFVQPDVPLMTMEEAKQRLGPKVLAALSDKFKGSLTDIRHSDENDILF